MKRKKNYLYQGIAWVTILLLTFGSFRIKEIVEAITADPLIEANVVYNEDQTQASIVFDLASVNQGTNEIVKITSEREGEVVYDASLINQSSDYDVAENGNYQFTVTYRSTSLLANQSDATSVESEALETTQVNVQVDGIQPTPETSSSEQTPMIDSEGDVEASTIETIEGALSTEESETVSSTNMSQEQTEASTTDETTTSTEASQVEEVNETPAKESKATTAYPQEILFKGLSISGNVNKAKFKFDPITYNVTHEILGGGYSWHRHFPGTYYKITVYKKGAVLGDTGTVVFEVKGPDTVQSSQMAQIETFDFEEGDMLQIWSAESKFNFLGSPVIASDGVTTIDYASTVIPKEKFENSVYEITAKGLKEIYNKAPVASGQSIPLYSLYGEGDWTDGTLENAPVYSDMVFTDDRNEQGLYSPNYRIQNKTGLINYTVANMPNSSTESGIWTSKYTLTDSWGRSATFNRTTVKLPKIDTKIKIEEMEDKVSNGKKVAGFVHFPGATVNTSSQTVTLSSGVVINADPQWEASLVIPYGATGRTRMIKNSTGDLKEVDIVGKYRVPTDRVTSVTIKKDSITVIATDYQVNLSETQIASLEETTLKEQIKEQLAQAIGMTSSELSDADIILDTAVDKTNPKAGNYQATLKFTNTSGTVEQTFNLEITSNPWSYDTPERTETNGASGFVVIPKGIYLQRDKTDTSQLSATAEVYFADYANATGVNYQVSVDETFEMMNIVDTSDKFTVTAASKNGQTGATNNILPLGNLTSTNTKGNGLSVTFTAPAEQVDKIKGRWQGNVRFYIERQ